MSHRAKSKTRQKRCETRVVTWKDKRGKVVEHERRPGEHRLRGKVKVAIMRRERKERNKRQNL